MQVGIISCPRPGTNYLSESLATYFDEWDIQPHIFEEPGWINYKYHSRVIRHINKHRLGCVKNWLKALFFLYRNSSSHWIMICEDDIYWQTNSGALIREQLSAKYSGPIVFSPYCSKVNAHTYRQRWATPKHSHNWCGALAIIMNRPAVEMVINNPSAFLEKSLWKPPVFDYDTGRIINPDTKIKYVTLDYAIGQTFSMIQTYVPTLVRHIGWQSTFLSDCKNLDKLMHETRLPAE